MANPTPTQQIQDLRLELESLKGRLASAEQQLEKSSLLELRDRIVTLEPTVAELKRHKEEAEKRSWQFIYIFSGAACAIIGGVVVQLVLHLLKK